MGLMRTFLGLLKGLLYALDGLRKVLHLVLLLFIFGALLAASQTMLPIIPRSAALVLAPQGRIVEEMHGDPLERALAEASGDMRAETLLRDLVDVIDHARDDERIRALVLDLDGDLRSLGRCDLAWAAMSIHHANDEVATLRALRSLIAPLGLLCVLERAEPLSVRCADELGRPGIWDRLAEAHQRWFEHMRPRLPGAMKAEIYPSMLAEAGLDVVIDRPLTRNVEVPRGPDERPAGHVQVGRVEDDLLDGLPDLDLDALRPREGTGLQIRFEDEKGLAELVEVLEAITLPTAA